MTQRTFPTTRRRVLSGMAVLPAATALSHGAVRASGRPSFPQGVASGDPLADRVILWTRAVPSDRTSAVSGRWEIAHDSSFTAVVSAGDFSTGAARDFTVKVDATGLRPGTRYYYRFSAGGAVSPTGQTGTLPDGDTAKATLAVVSCSNFPQGYFNAYKALAQRSVDIVLHLGDYLYEYGAGTYANAEAVAGGRQVEPPHEIITLDDYRRRYRQYRSDTDLQAVHQRHPFICVWDDHEITNDSYKDGAENHDPTTEGDYHARKRAAIQAYHEWMPIRENAATHMGQIYRRFDIGTLASLLMLETRLTGRDKQLSYRDDIPLRQIPFDMRDPNAPVALLTPEAVAASDPNTVRMITVPFDLSSGTPVPVTDLARVKSLDPHNLPDGLQFLPDPDAFRDRVLANEERHMLGDAQERWLSENLASSVKDGIRWQILGQQLLMGKLNVPNLAADALDFSRSSFLTPETFRFFQQLAALGMPLNLDAWDGYPAARNRVYGAIKSSGANAVVLAGDTHNAWAFNLTDTDGAPIGVEAGTPGISSPGLETYLPADPKAVENALLAASPELAYVDAQHRGWMEVTLTKDEARIDWFFVDTVLERSFKVSSPPALKVRRDSRRFSV